MTAADDARSYWERSASRYSGFMLLFGGPMPEMVQRVADEVEGAERVLELAAGTGLVSRAIAPVVGRLVAAAIERPGLVLGQQVSIGGLLPIGFVSATRT